MRAEIHPEYKMTTISCTCGAIYETRSTAKDLKIGICAACHPFFTGEQRFVDTAGRVEKFAQRYGGSPNPPQGSKAGQPAYPQAGEAAEVAEARPTLPGRKREAEAATS